MTGFHQLKKKSRMLLQVHDELIFEIHESEMDEVPAKIVELMENASLWMFL